MFIKCFKNEILKYSFVPLHRKINSTDVKTCMSISPHIFNLLPSLRPLRKIIIRDIWAKQLTDNFWRCRKCPWYHKILKEKTTAEIFFSGKVWGRNSLFQGSHVLSWPYFLISEWHFADREEKMPWKCVLLYYDACHFSVTK